jgi:ferrous iron transport protein A
MLHEGEEGTIRSITAGWGLVRRLMEMGFNEGVKVKALRASSGPLLLQIHDSRMAIGRGAAMKILVEVEG